MELENIRRIIGSSYWKFAKTMPHIPHWYTLRERAMRDEDFVTLVKFIRTYGYDAHWGRFYHRYLELDGWKYWTMGTWLESTAIINRERIKRPHRPIEKNPTVYQPTVALDEVYCPKTRKMLPKQNELKFDGSDE